MSFILRRRPRQIVPPYRVGSDSTGQSGTASSLTFANTVPTGTDLLALLIEGTRNADVSISSATWNGAGMTERIDVLSNVSGERSNVGIYWLASPTPAAGANIVVNFSGNLDAIRARAINLAGVDLGNPIAAYGSDTSTSSRSSASVVLAPSAPSLILGCAALSRVASSFTPGAGVTELADGQQVGGATLTYFEGEAAVDPAGSFTFGVTTANARSLALAAVAFAGG